MAKTEAQIMMECLQAFQRQYPMVTSGDLQTWVIGWQAAVKNLSLNLPVMRSDCDHDPIEKGQWMECSKCGVIL